MDYSLDTYITCLHWKIEDFSFQNGRLESPIFSSFGAEWYIEILLKDMCSTGDQVKISFCQSTDHKVKVNWGCIFQNSERVKLNRVDKINVDNNGKSCRACSWVIEDTFNKDNLPDDILFVTCYIRKDSYFWPQSELNKEILVQKRGIIKQNRVAIHKIFQMRIRLRDFEVGKTANLVEPMLPDKDLTIKLEREGSTRVIVTLEMPTTAYTSDYRIFLFRNLNKFVQFKEDRFKPDNSSYNFYLDLASVEELQSFGLDDNEYRFLFSCMYYYNHSSPNAKHNLDSKMCVSEDLRRMYEEGFLSDFSLRIQDKKFPVHKTILGARSSVFRAMFTADMKEKDSDHVDIPDVDADTIQRMLKFIYCDEVDENMQCESACSLYSAADKYALESLKQTCSNHLMANLSTASVIGVLLLSDTHQDQALKAAAVDFIASNDKEIVGKEQWNKFVEEHGPLSLEIFQQLYMKKMAV